MGLLKRVENGETTVNDADEIKNKGLALFILGFGVGIVVITIIFYLLGS